MAQFTLPIIQLEGSSDAVDAFESIKARHTQNELPRQEEHTPDFARQASNEDQLPEDKDLEQYLRHNGVSYGQSGMPFEKFWPETVLRKVMTKERIMRELQKPGVMEREIRLDAQRDEELCKLAETILSHHCKVFAALVLTSKSNSVQALIKGDVRDQHLPLKMVDGDQAKLVKVHPETSASVNLPCFEEGWNVNDRMSFYKYQFGLDPYIFRLQDDGTPKHEDFDGPIVLPMRKEKKMKLPGGYGEVTKVEIHEDCHHFGAVLRCIKTGNRFANKKLRKPDEEEFRKEVRALTKFSGAQNDHIVTLLMTWTTCNGGYHLLFPWAEWDLEAYWKDFPFPNLDSKMKRWTAKQIAGIASAISDIHELKPKSGPTLPLVEENPQIYGRHGDLKAENILLFNSLDDSMGILVVADLGLSTLNSIMSRSVQPGSTVAGTPRYKAPEYEIEGRNINQSCDIWSFGCLLLEWTCWLLLGWAVKEAFVASLKRESQNGANVETYFEMKADGKGQTKAVVHHNALQMMMKLRAHIRCTRYLEGLLDLIKYHMLQPERIDRMKAKQLYETLQKMAHGIDE